MSTCILNAPFSSWGSFWAPCTRRLRAFLRMARPLSPVGSPPYLATSLDDGEPVGVSLLSRSHLALETESFARTSALCRVSVRRSTCWDGQGYPRHPLVVKSRTWVLTFQRGSLANSVASPACDSTMPYVLRFALSRSTYFTFATPHGGHARFALSRSMYFTLVTPHDGHAKFACVQMLWYSFPSRTRPPQRLMPGGWRDNHWEGQHLELPEYYCYAISLKPTSIVEFSLSLSCVRDCAAAIV